MFRDMKERLNGPKDPTDFSMTSLRFKRNNPSRIFFPSQEDLFKENNRNKMRELILRSKLDLCSRYGAWIVPPPQLEVRWVHISIFGVDAGIFFSTHWNRG